MVSTNGAGLKQSPKEKRHEQRRQARLVAHQERQNHDSALNEFQPDAVEIERQSVPGGARWTLYTVVALMCATVAWSCWAEVDQIVVAEGQLITVEPPILIDTKLQSPIRTINVKFGDRVKAGQVLATLDPTFSEADMKGLQAKKKLVTALKARLSAEQEGREFSLAGHEIDGDWAMQYQAYVERQSEYQAKTNEFAAEESKLGVQQSNNKEAIKFHEQNYVDYRDYEKKIQTLADRGSKSEEDLLSRKLSSNDAKMKVQEAYSKELELEKELESLNTRRAAFLASKRTEIVMELVEAHEKFVGVEQELLKASQSNTFVTVTVPDSLPYNEFVVFEVSEKSVGAILEPGQTLFKLIPIGVPFEAEIEVQGQDVGLIRPATTRQIDSGGLPIGSEVRVKLASFPFQKHGTLVGTVRTISEGSFEKKSQTGVVSATSYKVRVRLAEPYQLERVPANFRLMPGMATTAEIKVGKRRVIEYFLYPLIQALGSSIREPR